jgi:hypothetical protein
MSTPPPFEFMQCWELRKMLGRSAWDVRELLAGIEDAPAESLIYHTRSYFLRSRHLAAPYPNDFATWVATQVRDRVLGERLAAVDPFALTGVESLREELMSVIDRHLSSLQTVPRADSGEPFHFMRSTLVEIPTGIRVATLREFRDAVGRVDAGAIYYHFYESSRRGNEADPLAWLQRVGQSEVAARLHHLHLSVNTLDGLRAQVLAICDTVLAASPP